MSKRFLTANWHHVCLVTYACPQHLLLPHCPPGTALELHDGNAHVSLVAFDFLQTRVFRIGWPGFRNFPEINLRFYVTHDQASITVTHRLFRADTDNTLHIVADPTPHLPAPNTIDHHFKEHQWGFGTNRSGNRVLYEVRHPHWQVFPVRSFSLDWNWEQVYGPKWAFLQQREPVSVMLAAGSGVEVFRPG